MVVPGGYKKVFTFNGSSIVWRKGKQLLFVRGDKSSEMRKQTCEAMLVDSVNLSQSSLTTHELMDKIENLKTGQLNYCESVRSLAQSVSEITTIIFRLPKKNNDICLTNIREHGENPLDDVKQEEYVNSVNSEDPIVPTNTMLLNVNNTEEGALLSNENALDLSSNENLDINLNATDMTSQKPIHKNPPTYPDTN